MGTTRLPVREVTRDEILKPLKRGDETYDDLLRRLAGESDGAEHGVTVPVTPELDTEAVDELADDLAGRIGMTADPGVVMDDEAVAELVEQVRQLQALVERQPERTADELEGRFR